ncbi:MAG: T9SS C-terminal target domain-containing protein, partial [Bacteroidetes bacterium]
VRDYLSLDTYEAVLDLSELVAGTYFVHLETDLGNLTRKIIVF